MIEDSKRDQPRFKGTIHGVKTIVAEEGYRGIYRGLGPVVSPYLVPSASPPISIAPSSHSPLFIHHLPSHRHLPPLQTLLSWHLMESRYLQEGPSE